ncbi:MAG: gliding motility-associated C-terminal domain-containing protein [Saprospiraceae bacterium]
MRTPVWYILILLCSTWGLPAQTCLPTDEPPGPFICWPLIEGFSASTAGYTADFNHETFCGTIENNSWFSFSPCEHRVVFKIESGICEIGFGVQAAIYNTNFELVSTCYTSGGTNFSGQMVAENLNPDDIYYVMIDGYLGDRCEYTIYALEGISPPSPNPILESLPGSVIGPQIVCKNSTENFQIIPPSCMFDQNSGSSCAIPNLSAYYDTLFYWDLPQGAFILGNPNTSTPNIKFDNSFSGGTISVSMELYSTIPGCNSIDCATGFSSGGCINDFEDFLIEVSDPIVRYLPGIEVCYGDCYEFRGQNYCASGTYQVQVSNPGGCDSTLVFELETRNQRYQDLGFISICGEDCITIANQTFCDEGFYELELTSREGCDSTLTFEILKHENTEERLPLVEICNGNCFTFDGIDYCNDGVYSRAYTSSKGCDSIITFEIKTLQVKSETLPAQYVCEGDCFTIGATNYCNAGNYTYQTTSKEGCDSLVNFNLSFYKKDSVELGKFPICESSCFEINGTQYCEQGQYSILLQNKNGCDSAVYFEVEKRVFDFSLLKPDLLQASDSNSIQLSSQLTGISDNLDYTWSGPGIDSDNKHEPNPRISEPGIYILEITDNLTGCSKKDTIEVLKNNLVCSGQPSVSLSQICDSAPFICGETLNGYCGATKAIGGSSEPFPGNVQSVISSTLENPLWATWFPCEENVRLKIATFNCLKENGVEWSVLESNDCENFVSILDSKQFEKESIQEVELSNLVPGNTYLFVWDGMDGDVCDFQIEVISGISKEPLQWQQIIPGKILGEENLCPGAVQTYNLVEPVCQLATGNCPVPNTLASVRSNRIKWNIPAFAKFVGDSTGTTITIEIKEDGVIPHQPPFPPSGLILSGAVSAEIESVAEMDQASSCEIDGNLLTVVPIPLNIEHELVMKKPFDVCKGKSIEQCGQELTESGYFICREGCTTIVQPVEFKEMPDVDYGVRQICEGDYYVLPLSHDTLYTPGMYEVEHNSKCGGVERIILEYYTRNDLATGPITEICNPFHSYYTISFDILQGEPPYMVNGQSIQGGRFVSQPIPNGTPYDFLIEDAGPCPMRKPLTGIYDCGAFCGSEPGVMEKSLIEVCGSEPAKGEKINNGVLDPDDVSDFILHTSPNQELGTVLGRNLDGEFRFDPEELEYDKTYYISYIIGNEENGIVDLDDPCIAIAEGQPVIFRQSPEITIAEKVFLNCDGTPVILDGSFGNNSKTYWTLENGQIFNQPILSINEPGLITIETVSSAGCSSKKNIQVLPAENNSIAMAGSDKTWECNSRKIVLSSAGSSAGNNFTYEWSSPSGLMIQGQYSPTLQAGSPGLYILKVTDQSNGCFKTDTVEIKENPDRLQDATFDSAAPSCFGLNDGFIKIKDLQGGEAPFRYSLEGVNQNQNGFFNFLKAGVYTVEINDAKGCTVVKTVNLPEPLEVDVELGDDKIIGLGEEVLLNAATSITPSGIYWWNDQGEEQMETQTWLVTPTESAVYHVRIEDLNGCQAEDEIRIFVHESSVYIPNAFSPNGDKKNDYFSIYVGESVEEIKSFKVFDRRGALIFAKENFFPDKDEHGWDGTFRGKMMKSEVFVYLIEVEFINGSKKVFKGDVTLLR